MNSTVFLGWEMMLPFDLFILWKREALMSFMEKQVNCKLASLFRKYQTDNFSMAAKHIKKWKRILLFIFRLSVLCSFWLRIGVETVGVLVHETLNGKFTGHFYITFLRTKLEKKCHLHAFSNTYLPTIVIINFYLHWLLMILIVFCW